MEGGKMSRILLVIGLLLMNKIIMFDYSGMFDYYLDERNNRIIVLFHFQEAPGNTPAPSTSHWRTIYFLFLTNPFSLSARCDLFNVKYYSNRINHDDKTCFSFLFWAFWPYKINTAEWKMVNLTAAAFIYKKSCLNTNGYSNVIFFTLIVIKCFVKEPATYLFGSNKERGEEPALHMKWVMAANAFSNYYFSGWNTFNQ